MADEVPTVDNGTIAEPAAPTPAATEPATQVAPPPAQPPQATGKTFTQEEVNRIMNETKKEVRSKFADYEDLKGKAARLAEIEQSQMTETQKLEKQLEDAKLAIARAEQARLDAETASKQEKLYSKIVSEAAKLNFEDPEDAYFRLRESVREVEEVTDAVKSLAETKKYLIKQQRASLEPFNPAGSGQQLQESSAQRRARIYGSGGSMFDPNFAEQHGGGVVWPKGPPTDVE